MFFTVNIFCCKHIFIFLQGVLCIYNFPIYICVYICVCMYMYVFTYMYVCICVYICIYIFFDFSILIQNDWNDPKFVGSYLIIHHSYLMFDYIWAEPGVLFVIVEEAPKWRTLSTWWPLFHKTLGEGFFMVLLKSELFSDFEKLFTRNRKKIVPHLK